MQESLVSLSLLLTLLLQGAFGLKPGPLTDLHIMGLFPMSGSWAGGQGCLPAAELGLEHVNNRKDILPGYKINMTWMDTQCIPGYGVHVMYKMFNEPPPKMIVMGGGCSKVSQPTAESSHYWNVVQMSYASVSPALSDKSRYPRFFRTSTSDVNMNPVRIAMMKHFNWNRVATISESLELYTKVAEDIAKRLPLHNITLITAEIFTDDPSVQIASLKKHDARIIMLGAYEDKGLKVFCEAYRQRLYGSHIVWFVPGWWNDNWWARSDPTQQATGCSTEQITEVAHGTFHTVTVHLNPKPTPTIFGITSGQYQELYDNYTDHKVLFAEHMAPQAYDGMMVIALVLNMTMNQLREKGSTKRLEDYTYDDEEMNSMIYDNFWRIRFQGVKGLVYFNENGDHPANMMIERVEYGKKTNKALYDTPNDRIDWDPSNPIQWKDGTPPADSTEVVLVPALVPVAIYVTMCALAVFGIILGIFFLCFNVRFRKRRVIKMSSPFINNIIVVGCMIVYSTVLVKELDTSQTVVMCQVRTFTLMIGFSTAFGALFAKTWRVHVIFTNKLKRMVMKDRRLVLIIVVIVGFDVILFTVFTVVDPMAMETVDTSQEFMNHGNTLLQSQVYLCTSAFRVYFDAIVYATKGLMLIFGTFLAWETRKVNIPALNDSQYIGVCIYNVVVLSIMGVVLAYVLVLEVTLHYVLTSAILVLGTTMTQAIIFVPKIAKLKEQGLRVTDDGAAGDDTKSSFAAKGQAQTTGNHGDDTATDMTIVPQNPAMEQLEKDLQKAKKEVDKLKKQLKEKEETIRRLQANS